MAERYPPIPPSELQNDPEKLELHNEMATMAYKSFGENGSKFLYQRDDGALLGPFTFFLHQDPAFARAFLNIFRALSREPSLPGPARETAILTVGAHFGAGYELYSHMAIAMHEPVGIPEATVRAVAAGRPPVEGKPQSKEEEQIDVAHRVARALVKERGPLGKELWEEAVGLFGVKGTEELMHYTGLYSNVCVWLNAFDTPVPEKL